MNPFVSSARSRLGPMAFLLTVSFGISGCIQNPFREEVESNWTVEEARQFDKFELFWLGEEYNGLPLTAVTFLVQFVYGTGVYHDSSSWSAPIVVEINHRCTYPPEKFYWEHLYTSHGLTLSETKVRGLDGYLITGDDESEGLRFWTGESVVTVWSEIEQAPVHQVAEDLVPVSHEPAIEKGPLPTPVSTRCFEP